ncbi:hypothetical protein BISA_0840 [Bifidobacterium saguini DSM 23967]|uniref:Uncharacterized protein n=2 Tax=Bifidobacterium saguini TaxID=762210 RepID=A0A087DA90_9BIFI|nr:hypothetical protein [Bifidobacterium saguini]KFI92440.1 hypothetical protein BISA_0840 [Bifidobacterium saguini DSM 23967]QTB90834.1 hypothetical protein BSD967_11220 [Bifidobacterium saguini]
MTPPASNLWPRIPGLPKTVEGVEYTDAGNGVIHAKGTATWWSSLGENVTLQEGEYTLSESVSGDQRNLYAQIVVDGVYHTTAAPEASFHVPAGRYWCSVNVRNGTTVDADITPALTRIG